MKALTICQPYAELIARGVKPIENRTWPTRYRGPLLIHAGKSRDWLDPDDERMYGPLVFGALVAQVELYDCVHISRLPPELKDNEHANGPFCFLLRNVERLRLPIQMNGAQGLWEAVAPVEAGVPDGR